jgi:hypothetical protein
MSLMIVQHGEISNRASYLEISVIRIWQHTLINSHKEDITNVTKAAERNREDRL